MHDDHSHTPRPDQKLSPSAAARRAQRFLEIVERITAANIQRLPEMTERYFRRMVLREAEHQLLFEEYQEQPPTQQKRPRE
jgi:hypothetical protein